jgi:hypothetical protein
MDWLKPTTAVTDSPLVPERVVSALGVTRLRSRSEHAYLARGGTFDR